MILINILFKICSILFFIFIYLNQNDLKSKINLILYIIIFYTFSPNSFFIYIIFIFIYLLFLLVTVVLPCFSYRMESIGNPSSQNVAAGIVPDDESRNEVEANKIDSATAKQNDGATKRKETEARSRAWEHFEKIKDANGTTQQAKCIYCSAKFNANPNKHGTSSMRNHMLQCKKMPHSKDSRQALLTFKPDRVEANGNEPVGLVGTWKFDQELIRAALAKMVVIDELPFRFVEGEGFRNFVYAAYPRFKIPSRWTVNRDCFASYVDERTKIKTFFKEHSQRVSLTTDSWTSNQRINYMCITAHFIDDEWRLHKKIISFVPISSHRGEYIAKALESCLIEWGLINIFSVTVDNASSNNVAISYFKKKLMT